MKIKLLFVIAVVAAIVAAGTMSFKSGVYTPRTASKIDEVLSFQRPGGRIAAGMTAYFNALRNNPLTGTVSEAEYLKALDATLRVQTKRAVSSVWSELGPDNIGGRTRAFLQDKDTPSLMFVGSVSGGLFRSTSRGSSWKVVNDFQENLNISCIAQAGNGDIVYGTGEGEFLANVSTNGTPTGTPGFSGAGIFRSINRGRSFTRVNSTSGFGNINSMASDLRDGKNIVYASTSGGLRKSLDGGFTWTVARSGNSKEVKVAVDGMVIAQSNTNIVKSTDEGQSWTVITPPAVLIGRAAIAISPEDPNYIYLMVAGNDSKLNGVYRTTNGGTNWTQIIAQSTTYFDPLLSGGNPQGFYDNVITVNPKNKNHIIMGGAPLAEWIEGNNPKYIASTNDLGGASPIYVHADKHVLYWDMNTNPPTLIVGTDGGLYFSSDNLKTFTPKNAGFNATQFYSVAADYEGNVTGGTQDNGSLYINKKGNTPMASFEIKGGDGFQSEISIKNNAYVFSETYYGNLTRSRDYGKTQSCIWDRRISKTFGARLTDTSKYCEFSHLGDWAPFNTKIRLWEHPDYLNTSSRMFIARYGQLWMGINVTDFQKEPEWYLIATGYGSNEVWEIEPTMDGNSVFFSNSSNIYRVDGLNSATYYKWSTPTAIPPGITMTSLGFTNGSGRAISSICLDPNDNNIALITLGNYGYNNYVYKGTNMLGTPSYTNITTNLPPMPVYDGLIAQSSSNLMFLATEFGIYASDDGGATWSSQTNSANNFPKVATLAIRQYLFPSRNRGSIYAGTHGRGFFECQQFKTNINSVQNQSKTNMMVVYPNPAVDNFDLRFNALEAEKVTINVYDFTGRIVMTKVVVAVSGKNDIHVSAEGLKAGTYIVSASGNKGNIYGTVKLVIRQ